MNRWIPRISLRARLNPWVVAATLLVGVQPAATPAARTVSRSFSTRQWTSEDGLPANRVTALAQTPNGYLWVGTWFGLARFDGVRFTLFHQANSGEFPGDSITALAVDVADGALWVGTSGGILQLRDGRFQRLAPSDPIRAWDTWQLVAARHGGMWVRAGDKIAYWHQGSSTRSKLHFQEFERPMQLVETDEGHALVVTTRALYTITQEGSVTEQALPPGSTVNLADAQLVPAHLRGRLWPSRQERDFKTSSEDWQPTPALTTFLRSVDFFHEDGKGAVWLARQEAGLWRHAAGTSEPIRLGESEAENHVTCLFEDQEGNIWIGASDGLFQLRPRLLQAVTSEDGLPDAECWSVAEAPNGSVWVETKRGLARIDGDGVRRFDDEPARRPEQSVLIDRMGTVWVGNDHTGAIGWRPSERTNRVWKTPGGVKVDALFEDRSGRLWVGTDHGVLWLEAGEPAGPWGAHGLPTNAVRSIHQTRDGTMWFGTWQAGLVRWSESGPAAEAALSAARDRPRFPQVTRFTTSDGLADNRVLGFHQDADGVLWIATHNGLSRYKDQRFASLGTAQGLLAPLINYVTEDDDGRFWFSCNRGIFRIDRSELNAVADGRKARASAVIYGAADGMPIPETNGEHQPSGCKTRDGRLWFPTPRGLVVIDPRAVDEMDLPPTPVIEEVTADGEVVFADGAGRRSPADEAAGGPARSSTTSAPALRLAPGKVRLLTIRYTANSFANPRRVHFQYRLRGHDLDWGEETPHRVASYTNLKPGTYGFEVRAGNQLGLWNESAASLRLELAPHFWERWSFFGACGLLGAGAVGALVARRLAVQRRILGLEHARALEQERTRIARDLHDELGTSLTGLALEMEVTRRSVAAGAPVTEQLRQMADHSRALAARMREVVWAISPRCDDVPGLATFLEQHAVTFVHSAGLRCRLEFPENLPNLPLAAGLRHQLALGVREALTNVVRHAHATSVTLALRVAAGTVLIGVTDDGCGFVPDAARSRGNGMANLQSRLQAVGGHAEWTSSPGQGTTVTFHAPLPTRAPA